MIRKIGIVVTSEMEDDDNNVKIIIKFPKQLRSFYGENYCDSKSKGWCR